MKLIKPTSGRISSKFGNRVHPVTKQPDRFHNGIDIAVPTGTKLVAPADGVVTTYYTAFGGFTMIISHDNWYESRMCHLSSYVAKDGDKVKQGEVVAISGNTGRSSGAHLHYGLKINSEYVNPVDYIEF